MYPTLLAQPYHPSTLPHRTEVTDQGYRAAFCQIPHHPSPPSWITATIERVFCRFWPVPVFRVPLFGSAAPRRAPKPVEDEQVLASFGRRRSAVFAFRARNFRVFYAWAFGGEYEAEEERLSSVIRRREARTAEKSFEKCVQGVTDLGSAVGARPPSWFCCVCTKMK